jgi:hypothetical protein
VRGLLFIYPKAGAPMRAIEGNELMQSMNGEGS